MVKRQIIAMGGGGFSMEPDNPLLDNYILNQSSKTRPKICFLGTASGDAESYSDRFYKAFSTKDCIPSHLSLFKGTPFDIEAHILDQDIIYVGGGNTRNLLLLWKEWKLDKYLKKAYTKGVMLAGLSAGSICWFEQGLTDSIPGKLTELDGLGILNGSNCPHFDGEQERQAIYKLKILKGQIKEGIACDDGVALHYENEKLKDIVSSRKQAFAYQFSIIKKELVEDKLQPFYLA